MHDSGSFILTVIDKMRFLLDSSASDARRDDDYLARQIIMAEYVNVISNLGMSNDNPIIARHSFSTVVGGAHYQLPPNVSQVVRLAKRDTTSGSVTKEIIPQGEFNFWGPGWRLEGNSMVFDPLPQKAETWNIEYIPSGDISLHYATDGEVVSDTVIELSASPSVGLLDRRENAYTGIVLRVLHDGRAWQERIVDSYDVETRRATVRIDFSDLPDAEAAVTYEMAPPGMIAVWEAVACLGAMTWGVSLDISRKKLQYLESMYLRAMKTSADTVGNMQGRVGKSFDKNTVDHPANQLGQFRFR